MPGVDVSDAGSMRISDGAHLQIGTGGSDAGGVCPFCGAGALAGAKKCSYCGAALVLETLRLAQLVVEGGSLTIDGGSLQIVGRQCRAIHNAAAANDLETVKAEVMGGDDPNFEDGKGRRPLHYAAATGALATAQWLLAIGAKANATDDAGCTPLQLATDSGHAALIDLFAMYSG